MRLDPEVLRQIRDVGGEPLVRELVQSFLDQSVERLERLRGGLESGDLETAELTAHSIRSSAATLGAVEVAAEAGALERAIHERSSDLLTTAYPPFEQRFAELVGVLRLMLD